jgi:hypothetical protein
MPTRANHHFLPFAGRFDLLPTTLLPERRRLRFLAGLRFLAATLRFFTFLVVGFADLTVAVGAFSPLGWIELPADDRLGATLDGP